MQTHQYKFTLASFALVIPIYSFNAEAQLLPSWPESPKNLPSVPMRKDSQGNRSGMEIKKIESPTSIRDSASQELKVLQESNRGKLFHISPLFKFNEESNSYVVGLNFNVLRLHSTTGAHSQSQLYGVSSNSKSLHNPNFSPDGVFLQFNSGFYPQERWDAYGPYLWDLKKGELRLIVGSNPKGDPLFFPTIHWSPGSRYLSYLRGGNAVGDYDKWTKPYRLFIYDTRADTDREVSMNAGLHWSWTYRGSVLFARVQPEHSWAVATRTSRPSVYEASARTLQPQKLFDGGYFAQASPDNNWVAFCDWAGTLSDAPNATPELKNNRQRGLFLWHRPTKRRVFVGELDLSGPPQMQWAPDGKNLFVLESKPQDDTLKASVWKMEIEQQTLNKLSEASFTAGEGWQNAGRPGFFNLRGISGDGVKLYLESVRITAMPDFTPQTQRTLIAIDTQHGKQTPFVQLDNRVADKEWDWLDDSVSNPAHENANKLEAATPMWKILPTSNTKTGSAKPQGAKAKNIR